MLNALGVGAYVLGIAVAVSACTGTSAVPYTTSVASLTALRADVQNAIRLYGIAKGIAEVAELAQPDLAPAINAAIAVADPLAVKVQIALDGASVDAIALEAMISQIVGQANSLTVQSAAVIKVVPSAS
jgi:hypothetical protein